MHQHAPNKGETGERKQIRISLTPAAYSALCDYQRRHPGVTAQSAMNAALLRFLQPNSVMEIPVLIDPNLIPLSERASTAFAAHVEHVRAAAYKDPRAAALAEKYAPGKFASVVSALLTNAYVADLTSPGAAGERAVVCPTGAKWFGNGRYLPDYWNRHETIIRALDGLHESNYVTLTRGSAGNPQWQPDRIATEYALRPNGRQRIGSLDLADFGPRPGTEVVILKAKSEEDALMPKDEAPDPRGYAKYDDTEQTNEVRTFVRALNVHLSTHRPVYDGSVCVPGFTFVRRIFNGSFALGGRFFGHWCQFAPKAERKHMSIDGQPLVEVDFSGMLVSLLYHSAGLDLPEGDVYDYGPLWTGRRDGMKRSTIALIMRNLRSDQFPAKVRQETKRDGSTVRYFHPRTKWTEVEAAILKRHSAIAPLLFRSDEQHLGLRLMRLESDILTRAMQTLMHLNIGFVPLHDGILCPRNRAVEVEMAMRAAYERIVGKTPAIKIKEQTA